MSTLTLLITERLVSGVTLASLIDQYDGEAAIFSNPLVPENAPKKYVWLRQTDNDDPNDTKLSLGRHVNRTIWCVAENKGSWAEVEAIAAEVRLLFHRKPLSGGTSSDAHRGWKCVVTGPFSIDSEDESVVCLAVTLDLQYTET